MKALTFVTLTTFLLAACASTGKGPDWVHGTSAKYPNAQYLTGRGQAGSPEEARDRARADLAKIFEVSIAAESEDVQKFSSGGAQPGGYEAQATRRLTTRTEQIVRGIQVGDEWRDPITKTHYALAVLPRLQTANGLRQEIGRLDDATRSYVEQSRAASDLFAKIAAASSALDAQAEREGVQKSLRVVDVTGRGLEPEFNTGKLAADLNALLKRVRVSARVPENSPAGFAEVASGAVAAAGFQVETGASADFTLDARLDLQDLGLQEGWYWQRGNVEIALTDAAGRSRGNQRWPLKASARDRGTAARRAVDEADRILKQELRATVVRFATAKPK